jgi:exodeoxyribonuclease V alpha subunit
MARTSTVSSTEVLAGLVERVTFHNDENGFCVLRVKARGQRETRVRELPLYSSSK